MNARWVEPDLRDQVVDFTAKWSGRAGVPAKLICRGLGVHPQKLCEWKRRYGGPNRHNGHVPREHQLTERERRAIVDFYQRHSMEGYRRCAYMMMDRDVA